MRPRTARSLAFLLLLLSSLFVIVADARAFEDEQPDDYEETARVARVSFVKGEVKLQRAGDSEWEDAQANFPLVEGDTLSTARDARVEIQIDARNFLRLGGDSVLRVVTLREEGVALSLAEGTAALRLARFDKDKEYFELDAPGTTVAAEQRGLYRVDADARGSVRVLTRDGARARIYSETSGFTLRENRSARLVFEGEQAGDWDLADAPAFDEWDAWTDERERYLASRLRFEDRERFYDREVWGAEELDSYGDWTHTDTYGWVWRPHSNAVSHYDDWAPYRYGRWTYCPPYGWTWVGDEPWGWAPYHYGRWVYHDNRWGWAPRGYGYSYRRAWWRPALVAFVFVPSSRGREVCWYPLTHGQRDPHSGFWRRNFRRLNELHRRDERHRHHPAFRRAVSSLPAHEFGRRGRRARGADDALARQVFLSDPVTGRLQVAPGTERGDASNREGRRPRFGRDWNERRTGAAPRTPGVALDRELRRSRVFRNREPRGGPDANPNGGDGTSLNRRRDADADSGRDTGAVARPPRRQRGDRRDPSDGPRRDTNA
ncbi:MAG TPA: DUF6600 domain-containing protein, partial [Pyrinomonadaceae bacterium]|nr:DUF6600 domain-containing protein [Pyrinomonadaceae bacterium]